MSNKPNQITESSVGDDVLAAFDGEAASYRRFFESLHREVPHAQALLVSTLPRGGTQIVQPASCPESLLKSYNRDLFTQDRATWQTLQRQTPLTSAELAPAAPSEGGSFASLLLEPHGLAQGAFAKVNAPLLQGYPGVLHVYRAAGEPAFTADEVTRLGEIATRLGDALGRARESRQRHPVASAPWEHSGGCRQFIFDAAGNQVQLQKTSTPLDERLRQSIHQNAQSRIASVSGEAVATDRIELLDTRGEVWAFRSVVFKAYPALGKGSFVFFCLQPHASEWNAVRPTDVAADQELARVIPTLKFMQAEFHRTPTLEEIAAKAHLSPFHFHRRFTELLGQTPKHFLLSCQIQHAKRLLVERKTPLNEIASECGFAHQSHFTSRFKQATGLTPTRWRRYATELSKGVATDDSQVAEAPGCAA